jgi:cell division septum initiation protein DivIVA
MNDFDEAGVTYEEPVKRRSAGSRFGDLGDRLARTFGGVDRTKEELPAWDPTVELDYSVEEDVEPPFEPVAERFPIARHGYDRAAVDRHVTELEQELFQVRQRSSSPNAVAEEIDRIGEQTAAILRLAHEKATEITRAAQTQADGCLAEAASNAVLITEEAKRQLHELDAETDTVWRERARLIEDARSVATGLFALAEDAAERFPPESDRGSSPVTVAAQTGEARSGATSTGESPTAESPIDTGNEPSGHLHDHGEPEPSGHLDDHGEPEPSDDELEPSDDEPETA